MIAVTAFAARLAHDGAAASASQMQDAQPFTNRSRLNHATATRGDDLPFVHVGATPASAPPG